MTTALTRKETLWNVGSIQEAKEGTGTEETKQQRSMSNHEAHLKTIPRLCYNLYVHWLSFREEQ